MINTDFKDRLMHFSQLITWKCMMNEWGKNHHLIIAKIYCSKYMYVWTTEEKKTGETMEKTTNDDKNDYKFDYYVL